MQGMKVARISGRTRWPASVRVTSSAPVDVPSLGFLVEVDWGQGRLVREYSALVAAPQTAAAIEAPVIEAPRAMPSDAIVREPQPAAAAAETAPEAGTDTADDQCVYSGHDNDNNGYTGSVRDDDDAIPYRPLRDTVSNEKFTFHFGSPHVEGLHLVYCDGSVHFVEYEIDDDIWIKLGGRDDEVVD